MTDTFQNENISIEVETKPGCHATLTVTVSDTSTEASYQNAIKAIRKEVSLPGFRKGKVPIPTVEKNYKTYIDQEWKEILVKTAFKEALNLTKMYPLSENSVKKPKIQKSDRKEGSLIVFEYQTQPIVPEIDGEKLVLKDVKRKNVTEDDINDTLKGIQTQHAEWEDITDRGVKLGDYVVVDIENADSQGDFLCKNNRLEVSLKSMGGWMIQLIKDKMINDVVQGTSERSKELDPDIEFKPTNCRITIKGIQQPKLPPLNDELAKKLGAESIDDLKEKVEKNLNKQSDEDRQHKLRKQLDDVLVKEYPFDVPESLVLDEKKNRMMGAQKMLKQQIKDEKELDKRLSELEQSIQNDIDRSFRLFFIAREIAGKNDIDVSQDELVKEIMMQMYSNPKAVDPSANPEELRSKMYVQLLTQKVKDFLIEKATIKD